MAERILVIKLSALGDFVLSLGAFRAIRDHHAGAELVLLTTAPFRRLAEASGLFDAVWLDERPSFANLPAVAALRRRLRAGRFRRVYDLQRSDRSGWYWRLLHPAPPEWVGRVAGCSHPTFPEAAAGPAERPRHIVEREARQLAGAGIAEVPPGDLAFVQADVSALRPAGRYALLVPGGSPHRPDKRWPVASYAALARGLAAEGLTPLLIGAEAERAALAAIAEACPAAVSLLGRTGLEQIVVLARGAELAVGNDTGPMHLIATAGCPCLTLFSAASDPQRNAPRGPRAATLRRDPLAELSPEEVLAAVGTLRAGAP
jgi:ADP-heptose:LPS heptosyltransferase